MHILATTLDWHQSMHNFVNASTCIVVYYCIYYHICSHKASIFSCLLLLMLRSSPRASIGTQSISPTQNSFEMLRFRVITNHFIFFLFFTTQEITWRIPAYLGWARISIQDFTADSSFSAFSCFSMDKIKSSQLGNWELLFPTHPPLFFLHFIGLSCYFHLLDNSLMIFPTREVLDRFSKCFIHLWGFAIFW